MCFGRVNDLLEILDENNEVVYVLNDEDSQPVEVIESDEEKEEE